MKIVTKYVMENILKFSTHVYGYISRFRIRFKFYRHNHDTRTMETKLQFC